MKNLDRKYNIKNILGDRKENLCEICAAARIAHVRLRREDNESNKEQEEKASYNNVPFYKKILKVIPKDESIDKLGDNIILLMMKLNADAYIDQKISIKEA